MKKILIIDASDLFREFLGQKLTSFGFEIHMATNGLDGILKMRQVVFDLIIMDFYLSRNSSLEVLERKQQDPNARLTPVIMASSKIERDNLLQVSKYGIRRFFTKPIQMDALVQAIAEILKVNIEVDNTPCIIDANCNDEIIFIEVAQGLNRDKIELLKFRLQELNNLYKLAQPKVIVMMTGLQVGPNDTLQLASLVSTIMDHAGAKTKNIKVLTSSEFINAFMKNRPNFMDIEVVGSVEQAMDALMGTRAADGALENPGLNLGNLFSGQVGNVNSTGFNLHFAGETKNSQSPESKLKELGATARIAIVDDDFVIREITKKAFSDTGIQMESYNDGADFMARGKADSFDLIFLDLMMPNMDGFEVLSRLKSLDVPPTVIILSALSKRETVIKAMGLGVKSYLIKPVSPGELRKKAVDVLGTNF